MPGFDRSGPMGAGPMTGGRRGFCARTDRADVAGSFTGYGLGRGYRRGRFWGDGPGRGVGRGFAAQGRTAGAPMSAASPPDELEQLTQEAQNLEKNLQMIQERIDELQAKQE